MPLKPYLTVFTNTLQRAVMFRARIIVYGVISIFNPLVMIAVWTVYYASGRSVNNYQLNALISYYLAVSLSALLYSHLEQNMTPDIKDGELTNYVIKPFSYFFFRLAWEFAWYTFQISIFLLPIVILAMYFHLLPLFNLSTIALWIPVLLLSYLISFTTSAIIGCLAFFITETTGTSNLFQMFSQLLTGVIFPLTFFPPIIQNILNFTPFRYTIYFSAQTLLGQVSGVDLIHGIFLQIVWLAILAFLYRYLWRQGIKKFSAVGL